MLTKENVENLIINKKNLNFTDKYYYKVLSMGVEKETFESHTPLTFSIATQDKELFEKLINFNADVNYAIEKWNYTPLMTALHQKDSFYLEVLLQQSSLIITKKIAEKDAFFTTLLLEPNNFDNLLILSKFIPNFDSKPILSQIEKSHTMEWLLDNMPHSWLHNQLDNLAIINHILNKFKTETLIIDKAINHIEVNKIFDEETVLSNFIRINHKNFLAYNSDIYENIVIMLLNKGHDINFNDDLEILHIIKDKEFYKNYTIEKNYIELNNRVSDKEKNKKKVKI